MACSNRRQNIALQKNKLVLASWGIPQTLWPISILLLLINLVVSPLAYWFHGTFSLAWNLFPIITLALSYLSVRFLFPWLCRHAAQSQK